MNILLLLLLVLIAVCNYIVNGRNILFPSVIVSGVFCISTLLLVINKNIWEYEISIDTVILIYSAVLLFSIGATLSSKILTFSSKRRDKQYFKEDCCSLNISGFNMMWISMLCLGITLAYAYHQYKLAESLGNSLGILGVVGTIRSQVLINPDVYQLGTLMNVGIAFGRAMGYICLFNIIIGFLCKDRNIKRYIIPAICLFINTVLSTGRSALITMTVACLFHIYIIQEERGIQKFSKKMIKYILIGCIMFFAVFWLLGNLTRKSGVLSLWDTISIYAGSSILCLDDYIKQAHPISNVFGLKTFVGVYNILNKIGFSFPQGSNHAEFVYWQKGNYSSNIYTALFPYIQDFSILGAIILQFFIGLLFGIIWNKYKSNNTSPFILITYGRLWGTPLAFYSIAEVLCTSNIALNTIVEIFFYIIIIRLVLKNYATKFKN